MKTEKPSRPQEIRLPTGTPGPWSYERSGEIRGSRNELLAVVIECVAVPDAEQDQNGRILAAAQRMRALLIRAQDYLPESGTLGLGGAFEADLNHPQTALSREVREILASLNRE